MTQPDNTPPGGWVVRTDAGARKIVERIDAAVERLDERINSTDEDVSELRKSVGRRLKHKVSIGWLVGVLIPVGGSLVAFVVKAQSDTRAEMVEARKEFAADVRQVRADSSANGQRTEAKVDALYKHLIEWQSRAAVKAQAERSIPKEN